MSACELYVLQIDLECRESVYAIAGIETRCSWPPGTPSTPLSNNDYAKNDKMQDKLAYLAWNALGNTRSQVPRHGCMHWLGEDFAAKV